MSRLDIREEERTGHVQGELPSGHLQDLGWRKSVWGTTGQEERVRDKAAELLSRDEG